MYTHAVSTSNFKYNDNDHHADGDVGVKAAEKRLVVGGLQKGTSGLMADSALEDISPVVGRSNERYSGNPLTDLQDEEQKSDDDEIVLNKDMDLMFDK